MSPGLLIGVRAAITTIWSNVVQASAWHQPIGRLDLRLVRRLRREVRQLKLERDIP